MKKITELNKEELKKLFDNNNYVREKSYELAYENAMQQQEDEGKELKAEVFDFHNHYNSFFLTTPMSYGSKCPELVAHKLNRDYMTEENAKLYDELNELTDQWENMDTDEQDENAELYDKMTETCDKLADGITGQLTSYEDTTEEQAFEEFVCQSEWGFFSDMETDGVKLYETKHNVYE